MSSLEHGGYSLRTRLQRQIGEQYVVERELGGGGSSRIFLAREVSLDRPVVFKVLPPELLEAVDAERFRREIHIAARLQHPHLVPLLNAGEPPSLGDRESLRWFSMPYIQGQTLRERLGTALPMALPESLRLLREVAAGLAYAHARGVVHRDLKPDNILLSDDAAMIADFGVAKALDEASSEAVQHGKRVTTASMALGTPAYMAPEQVNHAMQVDHKVDIYAWGCVAYELFAGTPPLARSSLRATLAAQVHDTPPALHDQRPDLPLPLVDLVMRCLAKDPLQRPHSATVILRTIDALTAPSPAPESNATPVATEAAASHRTSRRSPTARRAIVLLLLLLGAARIAMSLPWQVGSGR
jgi:eukaryotic-like serine/threonine-protein kinase